MEPSVLATSAARRRGRPPTEANHTPLPVAPPPETTRFTVNMPTEDARRVRTAAARYGLTVSDVLRHLAQVIPPSGELKGMAS